MALRLEHTRVHLKQLFLTNAHFHHPSFLDHFLCNSLPIFPCLSNSCQRPLSVIWLLVKSDTLVGNLMSSYHNYTQIWSHINGTSVSIHGTMPPFKPTLASSKCWKTLERRAVAMTTGSWQAQEDKSMVEEEGDAVSISRFNLGLVALPAWYKFPRDSPISWQFS